MEHTNTGLLRIADVEALETTIGLELKNRPFSELEEGDTPRGRAVQLALKQRDEAFRARFGDMVPPIWITEHFHWGPHAWPATWQALMEMKVIDCGVSAALSTQIFQWRGVAAFPLQLILRFNEQSVRGWQNLWRAAGVESSWCNGIFAYHEGTLVVAGGSGTIWDPLGKFWLPVVANPGYEHPVALRFWGAESVRIAGQLVEPALWYVVNGFTS